MLDEAGIRQMQRIRVLEDAYDALPVPSDQKGIEERLRIVGALGRAMRSVALFAKQRRDAQRQTQEDHGERMARLPIDPDTLERKHRALNQTLVALGWDIDDIRKREAADAARTGDHPHELARKGKRRSA